MPECKGNCPNCQVAIAFYRIYLHAAAAVKHYDTLNYWEEECAKYASEELLEEAQQHLEAVNLCRYKKKNS